MTHNTFGGAMPGTRRTAPVARLVAFAFALSATLTAGAALAGDATYTTSTSATVCLNCHADKYQDWSSGPADQEPIGVEGGGTKVGSMHALSWQDGIFQEEYHGMHDPAACRRCHLPTTAFSAGKSRGIYAPAARATTSANASEGVTCVSCHLGTDGIIHGPEGGDDAAKTTLEDHEHIDDPWLVSSDFCATCHEDPVFGAFTRTFSQWEASAWNPRTTCQSCHMPGGDHTWSGGHSDSQADEAFSATLPRTGTAGTSVKVRLLNDGAGHDAPTGDVFRSYIARITVKDAAGATVATAEYGIAPGITTPIYYAEEPRDRVDPVPAGGWTDLSVPALPAGTYTLTLVLSYQTQRAVTLVYRNGHTDAVEPTEERPLHTWSSALTL